MQKLMLLKLKGLTDFVMVRVVKKRGWELRRKYRKLLKTHIEKMSTFRLSMIFMKTKELIPPLQDVDEKKGTYSKAMQVVGYAGRETGGGGRVQVAQVVGTVDDPVVLVAGSEVENVLVGGQNDQGGEVQLGMDFDDIALSVLDGPRAVRLGGSEGTGEDQGERKHGNGFHGCSPSSPW
jgi:hypothetical protein